jgi:hypothetical protein
MLDRYLSTPGPFELSLHAEEASTAGKGTSASASVAKLKAAVRDGVNVLQRDPSMLTAVNTILKSCVGLLTHQSRLDVSASSDRPTAPSVQLAKKELLALCMCRVLHALPTRLFPAIAWRDRSDAWGSFKNVEFEELYAFILEQLTAAGKSF